MMLKIHFITILFVLHVLFIPGIANAQEYLNERTFSGNLVKDEITRAYLTPSKIIWQSDNQNNQVKNSQVLLTSFDGQLTTSGEGMCVLKSDKNSQASILLDFGKELYGGIEIAAGIRSNKNPVRVRIRFGE